MTASFLVIGGFAVWAVKPVGNNYLTLAAYVLVFVGAMLMGLKNGFWLDYRVKLCFSIALVVGCVGTAIGVGRGNVGALSEGVFFVLVPAVWVVLVAAIDLRILKAVISIFPFVMLAIGLVGVTYWLLASAQQPVAIWFYYLDLGLALGGQENGATISYHSISSLAFLLPFLLVSLMLPSTYSSRVSRFVAWPAVALGLCILLLSGRRGLMLALVISVGIAVAVIVTSRASSSIRRRAFVVLGAAIVAGTLSFPVFKVSPAKVVESLVLSEFSPDSPRGESVFLLLDEWRHAPVFGNGLGAEIAGFLRDADRPWAFEVQYFLVLNAVGIFGALCLAGITIWVLLASFRAFRRFPDRNSLVLAALTGTGALLIANATNPYLHTLGNFWMFFFLVATVNALLRIESAGDDAKPMNMGAGPRPLGA
ncbi:hypothetical protein C2138_11835 [Salinibacterium hongtaonis]|nr:hypothetical protein C2138_11835 [Salinibacterium hongtaonis]